MQQLKQSDRAVNLALKNCYALPISMHTRPRLFDLDDELVKNAILRIKPDFPVDPEGKVQFSSDFRPVNSWDQEYRIDREPPSPDKTRVISTVSKTEWDTQKVAEQVRNLKLSNDRKRKQLIDRFVVQKLLAEFFSIESIELGTLPDSIGDELLGMYEKGVEMDLRDMKDLIGKNVTRTLEHLTRRLELFLEQEMDLPPDVDTFLDSASEDEILEPLPEEPDPKVERK